MKKAAVLSLLIVLLSSTFGLAQTSKSAEASAFHKDFDAYIRRTLEKLPDVPGVTVVVIKDDQPIFLKAYGTADKEARKKADTNTLFYIASTNKAFTALAAAMLDKEGKIKLSDPITKYTSGIQFKNPLSDRVTVRDLLTHTSALQNSALVNRTAFTGEVDKKDIDYVFANGTMFDEANYGKYRYTNLGYNIYGLLLENNLGLKWQDVLKNRIFDPLGLKHTTARRSYAEKKKLAIAAPYVLSDQKGAMIRSILDKNDNNMQAAGGMFMSISDLGRWLNVNMNDGRLDGKQVISADLIRSAHTGYTKSTRNEPPFSGDGEYGLGWQIGKYRTEKLIYHHGGYAGYRSHASFMPEKKTAVGVLINNDHLGGRVADTLAIYAYDWWLKTENRETDYAKRLDDFVAQYEQRKPQVFAEAEQRAKRISQLTRPLPEYVGTYANDLFGTVKVTAGEKYLNVRMGNMFAEATPFTEKETIRVAMEPGGSGEVVKFNFAGERIESITYRGVVFRKMP